MIERTPAIILAVVVAAASASAQEATPAAADTASVILAPAPAPKPAPAPAKTEAGPTSSSVTAEISSRLPVYKPDQSIPTPIPDERVLDKPKNQIPRLPVELMSRYVVREKRIPEFREQDLYTREGLIDLEFKRNPWLHLFNFFGLKRNLAYEIIREEELAKDRAELTDEAMAMLVGGDDTEAKAMQQAIIDEAFENGGGSGGPVGIQ